MHPVRRRLLFGVLAMTGAVGGAPRARAHEFYGRGVTVIDPHTFPTAPGVSEAPVHARFEDVARDDRLIAAHSPFAGRVDLVAPEADGWRPLPFLELPAGRTAALGAGGPVLLMRGLTTRLYRDRSYAFTFVFAHAGEVVTMLDMDDD